MIQTLALILCTTLLGVSGQVLLKIGVGQSGLSGKASIDILEMIVSVIRTPLILLGLMFYGLGSIIWIIVLSKTDLSFAYPFLALNFILVAIASHFVLGETIPMLRWVGVFFIGIGVYLTSKT